MKNLFKKIWFRFKLILYSFKCPLALRIVEDFSIIIIKQCARSAYKLTKAKI
jgi:hypothetical protein